MKYKKHTIVKVECSDIVDSKFCYEIYKGNEFIAATWTFRNAKEFISSFDGVGYDWNVLC